MFATFNGRCEASPPIAFPVQSLSHSSERAYRGRGTDTCDIAGSQLDSTTKPAFRLPPHSIVTRWSMLWAKPQRTRGYFSICPSTTNRWEESCSTCEQTWSPSLPRTSDLCALGGKERVLKESHCIIKTPYFIGLSRTV